MAGKTGVRPALLAYDRMLARIRYRWQLLMALLVLAYAAASTVSSQPFAFIVTHTLITGDSYWTRVAQWRMIGPMVLDQPWFGIGLTLAERAKYYGGWISTSVDCMWLAHALEYGIPGSVLLFLSMVSVLFYRTRGPGVNLTEPESQLAMTLNIVMVVLVTEAWSVFYWGATCMMAGLMLGVRAHLVDLGRTANQVTVSSASARRGKVPEKPRVAVSPI